MSFFRRDCYFTAPGDELKEFKYEVTKSHPVNKQVTISALVGNRASHLYLWTEKGALLHAKSLNTDKAWEVYDYLVDFYFRVKEEPVVKEAKPESVKAPSGREVVDIPENVKIQKAIKEAEDYITALSVVLKEYNMYRSKKSYEDYYMMLNNLSVTTTKKLLDLLELKPNMVIKAGY